MSNRPDSECLSAYAESRCQDAFRCVVVRHQRMVFQCCRAVLGRSDWAEDAAQAVFLLVHEQAGKLSERDDIRSWLIKTSTLVSKNMRRKEIRRLGQPVMEPIVNAHEPENPTIRDAFGELSAKDQEILWMRFGEERDFSEIAKALRIGSDAARMRCNRAVAALRGKVGLGAGVLSLGRLESQIRSCLSGSVSSGFTDQVVASSVEASVASTGVWLALQGAKTAMRTKLYGFTTFGVLTVMFVGGIGILTGPIIQERLIQTPAKLTFLSQLAGNWTGELEYANYSDDEREMIATESVIEVLPSKTGVKITTTYPGHQGNILESSTYTFDKDLQQCAISDVPGKHKVVSSKVDAGSGKIVVEGRIKEENLGKLVVVPMRITIWWTKDSLTTRHETREPFQFRNESRLRRIE